MSLQFQQQSFWKTILTGHKIVIPAIQRDYAQGRKDDKTGEIRARFLDDLIVAIAGPRKLVLDFIYGLEEEVAGAKCWIPIDGQQRLTTLYLLHTYAFGMAPPSSVIDREVLSRFQYAARESTQEFCNAWLQGAQEAIGAAGAGSLKDVVCARTWFARSWVHDPTVASMLLMLDAIHERRAALPRADVLWQRLTKEDAITFMFLDLREEGLRADELYIRMNARGRLLQPFEHFKAFLLDKCVPKNDKDSWGKLLDGNWSELFWKHRNAFQENKNSSAQDNDYDNEWMQAFRGFALISAGLYSRDEKEITHLNDSTEYIAFNTYKQLLGPEFLDEIKAWLNAWYKLDEEIKSSAANSDWAFDNSGGVFESFLSQRPGLKTIARFYAASLFLAANNTPFSALAFRSWMRVVRNWTEALQISASNFGSVLGQTRDLAKAGSEYIYQYLEEPQMPLLITIGKEQIDEEREKARLIREDNADSFNRESLLNALERSPYLKGNISALLTDDWETMVKRAEAFGAIFGKVDDSLIIQAMLAEGDYAANRISDYWEFGGGREAWWRVLTNRTNAEQRKKSLTAMLDKCRIGEDISVQLKSLRQQYLEQPDFKKDWRYYFIKYPDMTFKVRCKSRHYYWNDNDTFKIKRHNDENYHLNAYHFNPFAVTALKQVLKDETSKVGWADSTTQYGNEAPIKSPCGVSIFCESRGWKIVAAPNHPAVFGAVPGLIKSEESGKPSEWWINTRAGESDCVDARDRIEALTPLLEFLATHQNEPQG